MPKGALLHAHLDATVDAVYLLKLALSQPAIHVRTPRKLDETFISSTLPQFLALPPNESNISNVGLTDTMYVPETWVPIAKARESFDPKLGGPEGFDKWVVGSLMINPNEAYNTHNTINKVWLLLDFPSIKIRY